MGEPTNPSSPAEASSNTPVDATFAPAAHTPLHLKQSTVLVLVVFLVVALAQGAYYIHVIGPLTMPDPDMHAMGTYAVATGQSFSPVVEYVDGYGNPRKGQALTGDDRYLSLIGANNGLVSSIIDGAFPTDSAKSQQQEAMAALGQTISVSPTDPKPHLNETTGAFYSRSNQYFPLAWAIPGLGMRIGMAINPGNVYFTYQCARAVNLAFYLLIYGLAILLVPRMRGLLMVLGLIPTTLFCASSLMCDGSVVALCTLSVALTCRAAQAPKRLGGGYVAALTAIACAVLLIKPLYAPICMGYLIMPKQQLGRRRLAASIIALAVAALAYLLWSAFFGDMAVLCNQAHNKDAIEQSLLGVGVRLFYNIVNLPLELFGMNTLYLVYAAIVAWICSVEAMPRLRIVFSSRCPSAKERLSECRYLVGTCLVALIVVAGTFAFLLYTWNDIASQATLSKINGFQGRYLLPLWPLLAYAQTIGSPEGATGTEARCKHSND